MLFCFFVAFKMTIDNRIIEKDLSEIQRRYITVCIFYQKLSPPPPADPFFENNFCFKVIYIFSVLFAEL